MVGAATPVSAGLLGIDPGTVAGGRKQLLAQDIERERVRRPGGGRPPLEKTPEVIAAIESALQHDVAGDPITGIRWTRRTTEKIATELATLDIQVSLQPHQVQPLRNYTICPRP